MSLPRFARPAAPVLAAGGTILAVTVASGWYYVARYRSNSDYLVQRDFRVLAITGRQLQDAVGNVAGMMEAHVREVQEGTGPSERASVVQAFKRSQQGLFDLKPPYVEFETCLNEEVGTCPARRIPGRPRAQAQSTGPSADLVSPGKLTLTRRHDFGRHVVEVRAEIDLTRAIRPFLVEGVFDSVVLVNADRRVVMATPRDLNVTRIEPPAPAPAGRTKPAGAETSDTASAPVSTAPDPTGGGEPVARPESFDLRVAESPYRVFWYGLELVRSSTPPLRVGLAGLVPVSRLQEESLALNPFWVAALVLVVISGVLLWPFLRIWLMGPAEPLRVSDLVAVVLCLVLGVGLGVLVSLDAVAYELPRPDGPQDVKTQLSRLSEWLSSRFDRDLEDGLTLLRALRALPPHFVRDHPRERLDNDLTLLTPIPESLFSEPDRKALREIAFGQVTWITKNGMQTIKWAHDGMPPPGFSVEDREYFRAIRDHRGWSGTPRFVVDAVRSRSTGKLLAVFSAPADDRRQDGGMQDDRKPEVVAVGMRPRSVIDPVLPAGFEFAVIEAGGRIVFDSHPDRALEGNFFEECQQARRLRAAVESRVNDTMTLRYWGRDHVLTTRPLRRTPWSLLVYFRTDQLRAAHFQTLSVSGAFFLAMVVAMALYGGLARALTKEGAEAWLSPRPGTEHRLVLTAALLLILGGLSVGLAGALDDAGVRLGVAFFLPLAAVGAVVGLLGTASAAAGRRVAVGAALYATPLVAALAFASRGGTLVVAAVAAALLLGFAAFADPFGLSRSIPPKLRLRGAYAGFVLSALLCCAAVPAAVLFQVAWDQEMENYQRSVQLDLARRVYPPGATASGSSPIDGLFVASGLLWNTRVERGPDPAPPAPSCLRSPLRDIVAFRPFEYPASRMSMVWGETGCDGSWAATVSGSERRVAVFPPLVEDALVVRYDPLDLDLYGRGVTWVPLAALAVGALVLVGLLLRRSFLVDFSDAHTVSLPDLATLPLPAKLLVLAPSFADLAGLRRRPGLGEVSLVGRSAADVQQLAMAYRGGGVLCLTGFEDVARDPQTAAALLDWLEDVTASGRPPVVIVSEREPESVLRLSAGHEVQAQARRFVDRPESRRWARVLAGFVRVVAHDPGDREGFQGELEAARSALHAQAPAAEHAAIDRLLSTVRAECLEHGPLQAVGLAVVRIPGFPGHDPYRLVRHIRELADRFYRAVWSALTDNEKLLLSQLASGHLVNPESRRALNRLLALRLVVRRSRFELVNRSFGEFVLAAVTPADLAEWRRSCQTSTWAVVRAPAFVTLAGLGAFLAYTQRDFLPAMVGVVGAAVPLLVKLLDVARGVQGQAKPAR